MPTESVHKQARRAGGPWFDVEVSYRFAQRELGGWEVVRADTGQDLGWVTPTGEDGRYALDATTRTGWKAHMPNSAFYPADADIVDRTQKHPRFHGRDWATAEDVGWGRTREEAVHELLYELLDRDAAAVADLFAAAEAAALEPEPRGLPVFDQLMRQTFGR